MVDLTQKITDAETIREYYREHNIAGVEDITDDNFWMAREVLRFDTGHYKDINLEQYVYRYTPYGGGNEYGFVHLSLTDPKLVSYTPNEIYGKQDRQLKTRFSKYLREYFDYLQDDDIRVITTRFNAAHDQLLLRWAEGADEIHWVYKNCSTKSCMSHDVDFWNLRLDDGNPIHPTAAYDSPDIGVAYVVRASDTENVIARAVVNKVTNRWVRIYGSEEYILPQLQEAGFKRHGSLEGAKLRRISVQPNHVVCPYLDGGVTNLDILDDGLLIKNDGRYPHASYTLARIKLGVTCDCCGETTPDHLTYRRSDNPIFNETRLIPDEYDNICSNCIIEYRRREFSTDPNSYPYVWVHNNDDYVTLHPSSQVCHKDDIPDSYILTITGEYWLENRLTEAFYYDEATKQIVTRKVPTRFVIRPTLLNGDAGSAYYKDHVKKHFKELAFSVHSGMWIYKEDGVKAINSVKGARTLVLKRHAVQDSATGEWYTRKYISRVFYGHPRFSEQFGHWVWTFNGFRYPHTIGNTYYKQCEQATEAA